MKANDPNILSLMKITNYEGKTIPWEYNLFPDGQVQFKVLKENVEFLKNITSVKDFKLSVKVSLCNPTILDLFNQFKSMFSYPNVTINYFYGARCDKFESGDYYVCNVAQIEIRTNGIVKYLAPHCDEMLDPDDVIFYIPDCINLKDYHSVICPDESAYRRYKKFLNSNHVSVCEKVRDQETGRIISHKVPNHSPNFRKVLVLDDLCDGGATFISVANSMPENVEKHLFIFHGVFSNNALERLTDVFDKIFVSNSLPNYKESKERIADFDNKVVVFDVWE